MPKLHLPRASYDLFVYDFRYGFSGSKLRRMPCLHSLRSPCDFFRRQIRTDLTETLRRSYGNRTAIDLRTKITRAYVRSFLGSNDYLKSCVVLTIMLCCFNVLFLLDVPHKIRCKISRRNSGFKNNQNNQNGIRIQ